MGSIERMMLLECSPGHWPSGKQNTLCSPAVSLHTVKRSTASHVAKSSCAGARKLCGSSTRSATLKVMWWQPLPGSRGVRTCAAYASCLSNAIELWMA